MEPLKTFDKSLSDGLAFELASLTPEPNFGSTEKTNRLSRLVESALSLDSETRGRQKRRATTGSALKGAWSTLKYYGRPVSDKIRRLVFPWGRRRRSQDPNSSSPESAISKRRLIQQHQRKSKKPVKRKNITTPGPNLIPITPEFSSSSEEEKDRTVYNGPEVWTSDRGYKYAKTGGNYGLGVSLNPSGARTTPTQIPWTKSEPESAITRTSPLSSSTLIPVSYPAQSLNKLYQSFGQVTATSHRPVFPPTTTLPIVNRHKGIDWAQLNGLKQAENSNRFRQKDLTDFCKDFENCKDPSVNNSPRRASERKESSGKKSPPQTIVIKFQPVIPQNHYHFVGSKEEPKGYSENRRRDSLVSESRRSYRGHRVQKEAAAQRRRYYRRPFKTRQSVVFPRKNDNGGLALTSVLLSTIPVLLTFGLGLGYLASNGFGFNGVGVNNTNIININGTTITNTFNPQNTATATNNDDDTITINTGRRRKKREAEIINNTFTPRGSSSNDTVFMIDLGRRKKDSSWNRPFLEANANLYNRFEIPESLAIDFLHWLVATISSLTERAGPSNDIDDDSSNYVVDHLYRILGTDADQFPWALWESSRAVQSCQLLEQSTALLRKMSCLNALNATQPCLDRIVCEHFGDDHRTFRGNLLVRASEIFLVTLLGIWEHRPLTIDDVGDLWNLGGQERCEQVYGICELQRLHECLDIL